MLIYLGTFYLLLGTIFLFLPLIFIELGRPRDLIKSAFYLLTGVVLITKYNFHDNLFNLLIIFLSFLLGFHIFEIFSFRYNLLTEKEKSKLKNLLEIKKSFSKFLASVSLVLKNSSKLINLLKFDITNKSPTKKWVRNNDDTVLSSDNKKVINLDMAKKTTIQPEKDIIK